MPVRNQPAGSHREHSVGDWLHPADGLAPSEAVSLYLSMLYRTAQQSHLNVAILMGRSAPRPSCTVMQCASDPTPAVSL